MNAEEVGYWGTHMVFMTVGCLAIGLATLRKPKPNPAWPPVEPLVSLAQRCAKASWLLTVFAIAYSSTTREAPALIQVIAGVTGLR